MAAKKETYSEAMKRLEEIVSRIESNELDTSPIDFFSPTGVLGSRIFLHSKSIRAGKFHASAAADIACVFSEAVDSGNT